MKSFLPAGNFIDAPDADFNAVYDPEFDMDGRDGGEASKNTLIADPSSNLKNK